MSVFLISHNYSYGQLTQIHPEVDEYKLAYAQVCETRKVFMVNLFLLMIVRFLYTCTDTPIHTHKNFCGYWMVDKDKSMHLNKNI